MSSSGSLYEVDLFKQKGFQRKQCVKCGKHYWTLDANRTTCGDPPCDEYSFIGNAPTKKKFSLHEMRELYLSFFEKNGHKRVSRYPIVARWRDDVFFTQASIYCFQPWVINGVIKPPANPLTISQTCVRFNDIDNVGKTGRHFTMFEMMAHHCFNTKGNYIYFRDKTVELCYRLLVDEISVKPEAISFIEADWAGGGNSGPCFETLVSGIELSTLVFMMYEEKDGVKKEMDMQVVDTGYGLERFTWISQGTSSAYEAVFGDVLRRLKKEAGISGDPRILGEYSRVAGIMNVESNVDLKILRKKVAERLGITTEKLESEIGPMENLYAVCDHTRALMFMLQDGVVPSNVKEGYFARMLVRRTVRALNALRLNIPLKDIIDLQVDYFQSDFPELAENCEDILRLSQVEEDKYRKTIEKGRGVVARIDDKLREDKKTEIDLDTLIGLYDSQGLSPELVSEFSSLKVDVPDDFYVQVGQRHEMPEAEKEKAKTVEAPKGIAATIAGYYLDRRARTFTAKVLKVFGDHIVLDKTYFYPEGGGQETDLGTIGAMPVEKVEKAAGNVIVHKVKGDASKIKEGDTVNCVIDWARRTQLAQHHTATHIVNGAARRVLGNHVWQTGAHKSVKGSRLDITHYEALTKDQMEEIECLSNKTVAEGRVVDVTVFPRDEAERRYGFRLYQGGVVPGGEIRVVNIRDWDVEACGGIHLENTKDSGYIKITGSKRIQDGVVRLEFVAGAAAGEWMESQREIAKSLSCGPGAPVSEKDLGAIAAVFSVAVADISKTVKRFQAEWAAQKEEIVLLEKKIECLTALKCYHDGKYGAMPSGDSYSEAGRLFEEWKTQKKEIALLRQQLAEILYDDLENKFVKDSIKKEDVRIIKETVRDMNAKSLSEVARKVVQPGERLLILVNLAGDKASVVVASNCDYDASDVAKKVSALLGGGAHGDKSLAMGGGSAAGAEEKLKGFIP